MMTMPIVSLSSKQLGCSLILIEEIEEVEVGCCLAEDCWLDTKGVVWSVKVNSSDLRSLHTASKLGCGYSLSVLTTETKTSLKTWANGVRVSIIDSTSDKTSNTIVTVSVQLKTSSEGCSNSLSTSNLCSETKLWNNLTIGIQGCS